MKWITVYASSSDALNPIYYEIADQIAEVLANNGYNLVYGGSKVGIMGRLAEGMKLRGSQVIGIIPRRIHEKVPPLPEIDELIITETMYERKEQMALRGDAYICLPGGFGTLEEMLEIITQKQLKYHNKPILICNYAQAFEHLFAQFEFLIDNRFAKPLTKKLYHVFNNANEILPYLSSYVPLNIQDKWYDTKNGFKLDK